MLVPDLHIFNELHRTLVLINNILNLANAKEAFLLLGNLNGQTLIMCFLLLIIEPFDVPNVVVET